LTPAKRLIVFFYDARKLQLPCNPGVS
jgi:hypothetical protein